LGHRELWDSGNNIRYCSVHRIVPIVSEIIEIQQRYVHRPIVPVDGMRPTFPYYKIVKPLTYYVGNEAEHRVICYTGQIQRKRNVVYSFNVSIGSNF